MKLLWILLWVAVAGCLSTTRSAMAEGEASNGYPNWSERVLLEWMNRGRSDPQTDLAACASAACKEKACYSSAAAPRHFEYSIQRSSRFHSNHLMINNYFDHPSHCTLVANIATIFPDTCGGAASCSCTQGALGASATWTSPDTRMNVFGGVTNAGWGEIIAAGNTSPDATYYQWLYETAASSSCTFDTTNGHRYLLLVQGNGKNAGAGFVVNPGSYPDYAAYATMDFAGGTAYTSKIPSGSHYPQQASSVDAWTNWYDTAGPSVHKINVDGVCTDMALLRGSQTNGAWHLSVGAVATGCHRYNFAFKDSAGKDVLYPTNGSLAIGNGGAACADWSSIAPPACAGFDRIFAYGFEP